MADMDDIHQIIAEFVPIRDITSEITINGNYICFQCNRTVYSVPIKPIDEETGDELFPIILRRKY